MKDKRVKIKRQGRKWKEEGKNGSRNQRKFFKF